MQGDFTPPQLAMVQGPLTDAGRQHLGPAPTAILPRPPRPASPSVLQDNDIW
jgi:hypothetical protein